MEDEVNINRFVTGAQKTERHHVETAFDICLETAKLTVRELEESKPTCDANMIGIAGRPLMNKQPGQTTVGVIPTMTLIRAQIDVKVDDPGREDPLSLTGLGTAGGVIYCLLVFVGWYWLK